MVVLDSHFANSNCLSSMMGKESNTSRILDNLKPFVFSNSSILVSTQATTMPLVFA